MTKSTLKQSSASVSISEDSIEQEQFSNDPVAKPKTERQ